MKIKIFTVITLAVALFLSACGKSDADLQKAATDKLAADKVVGVTVVVKDGVANLTGEVADQAAKGKAEATVKLVEGIKSVTNNCTLKPLPPPVISPDKLVEGTINEGFKKKGITGITVTVANGEVTLNGIAPKAKWPEIIMVANEAKAGKVINKLTEK